MRAGAQAYWLFALVAISFLPGPGPERLSAPRVALAVVGISLGVTLLLQGRAKT